MSAANPASDTPTSRLAAPPPATNAFFDLGTPGIRDLAYASALIDGSERMHGQEDLITLLPLLAAEAVTIISADAAAIVRYAGIRRKLVDSYLDPAADIGASRSIGRLVEDGRLHRTGYVDDLGTQDGWTDGHARLSASLWRSLMIVALDSPIRQDQIRLVWFSTLPHAFATQTDVAELFGRHASLAIRAVADGPTEPGDLRRLPHAGA